MVASRSIAVGKHGRGNDDIYSNVIIRSVVKLFTAERGCCTSIDAESEREMSKVPFQLDRKSYFRNISIFHATCTAQLYRQLGKEFIYLKIHRNFHSKMSAEILPNDVS